MSATGRNLTGLAALVVLGVAVLPADAGLVDIRVDFNNTATTPSGWYLVADQTDTTTVHSLTDYNTGLPTGITLQITDAFAGSTINQTVTWSNPYAPWVDTLALRDYAALGGSNTAQIVLSGFGQVGSGNLLYVDTASIELLSYRNYAASTVSYLINGVAGEIINADGTSGGSTTTWNAQQDGFQEKAFMQWSAEAPDGNGRMVIDISTGTNQIAFLNGMRISYTPIPEPSSAMLLLLVAASWGLWNCTRRRPRSR